MTAGGIDFGPVRALSFDCYGTLVDWESGILGVLRPLIAKHERPAPPDAELLELYGRFEASAQAGGGVRYRDVLRFVLYDFASRLRFALDDPADQNALADALPSWPLFPDAAGALAALKARYKLAILSNIDDDLFARTAERFPVEFDEVVTAEQVGSYKPDPAHFEEALRRLGLDRDQVVHVAQSRRHDIAPANALGIRCVWVDRPSARPGSGATMECAAAPDMVVRGLDELVEAALG